MGSKYFGDQPNNYMNQLGRSRGGLLSSSSSPSSSSSRKGKNNSSEKPKQPQRGLGVAQLEKIRLHSQQGCPNYLPSHHQHHHVHNNPNNFIQEAQMRVDTPHPSSSSSSSPSYNGFHGHIMGLSDFKMANTTYGDSQSSNTSRWHQGNVGSGSTQHYFVEPSMSARSFFEPGIQGSLNNKNKRELMDLMGSSAHNSESQDLDLELRL